VEELGRTERHETHNESFIETTESIADLTPSARTMAGGRNVGRENCMRLTFVANSQDPALIAHAAEIQAPLEPEKNSTVKSNKKDSIRRLQREST
jgi:hypothetical protein